MTPSLYEIPVNAAGRLFIMPKPSGEWLDDDIKKLKLMGIDHIVSMLTPEEADSLALANEGQICKRNGINFTNVPVVDRGIPEVAIAKELALSINADMHAGSRVAIHCRAGIGRSGVVACCVLIGLGSQAENALEQVSAARGVLVPDTIEQRKFILEFS
ncbi:dual specificity protein phosphatase family protein [Roseibium sp. MMSF_3544]|uniref:protein-tyrosine phosphatase family protein n=1 Tax=unclassified Roseibium TaxID=2629323 RepID=UPI00273E196A|nr:dual specificity protein phosphatase family protein [Roseibium sp. MMSF_3544]